MATPAARHAAALLAGYRPIILSLLGAVHWGPAIAEPSRAGRQAFSLGVAPALAGWCALMLLVVAFAAGPARDVEWR